MNEFIDYINNTKNEIYKTLLFDVEKCFDLEELKLKEFKFMIDNKYPNLDENVKNTIINSLLYDITINFKNIIIIDNNVYFAVHEYINGSKKTESLNLAYNNPNSKYKNLSIENKKSRISYDNFFKTLEKQLHIDKIQCFNNKSKTLKKNYKILISNDLTNVNRSFKVENVNIAIGDMIILGYENSELIFKKYNIYCQLIKDKNNYSFIEKKFNHIIIGNEEKQKTKALIKNR